MSKIHPVSHHRRHDPRVRRDQALRRAARLKRWLIAGTVAATGVLSEVAAQAFPGKTVKAASTASSTAHAPAVKRARRVKHHPRHHHAAAASTSSSTTSSASSTSAAPALQAPSQPPAAAPTPAPVQSAPVQSAPAPAPAPVTSGGS